MKTPAIGLVLGAFALIINVYAAESHETRHFVNVQAANKYQRTELSNLGMSIEAVLTDGVWGFVDQQSLNNLKKAGFTIKSIHNAEVGRGGHGILDFPSDDSKFHNYAELTSAMQELANAHPSILRMASIGKSIEGRDIWAFHFNSDADDLEAGRSTKPGMIILGTHHAREHLSTELPLMFAQHLAQNASDVRVAPLIQSRDIWIVPMVNPDGVEHDIATGRYRMWRKNRRVNSGTSCRGVDLNRNYGHKWDHGGSSANACSDVYHGQTAFSEPETQAVKAFVESHLNANILLSVHTFSELILYPWGWTYDGIDNTRDRQAFEAMATQMAEWNGYTPQQASDLYIASGDTTDWAYGEHGIFSFTFELSPKSMWSGGFYPGQSYIDKVFADNIRPMMYLLELADNPYRAIEGGNKGGVGFLKNYVPPATPVQAFLQNHPF